MRKLFYIFILVFLANCSKRKEMNSAKIDALEIAMPAETFENQVMLQQKLQDYYDLVFLKENYPDFNAEVNEQLNNLVYDTLAINLNKSGTIKNLNLIQETIISNSVKEVKLQFDIADNNTTKKDSITAIITTKKMIIDGNESIASKIKFKKN